MKLTFDRDELIRCVNIVQKAVSQKSSMQVLEGILIESQNDLTHFYANDLELAIDCVVDAVTHESGAIVLNSKMFGDIVRRLPRQNVTIETSGASVNITCGKVKFTMAAISAAEFTKVEDIDGQNKFDVPQDTLKNMIRQTLFAVGNQESKPTLMGAFFEVDQDSLSLVSCDSYKLAIRKCAIDCNEKFSFIIPHKTLVEVSKILEDTTDTVNISVTRNKAMFTLNNCKVVTRLIEGEFINYKSIIPADFAISIITKTNEFEEAVERAAIVLTSDTVKSPVIIDVSYNNIEVSCATQVGNMKDSVFGKTNSGELKIGFNHKFVLDALKATECEEVQVLMNGQLNPCVIKPVEGDGFLYMILPVRI